MTRAVVAAGLVLSAALAAGCASPPPGPDRGEGGDSAGMLAIPPTQAQDAIRPGLTREAVRSLLGDAAIARFASGYEVWVYRFPATGRPRPDGAPADRRAEMTELVVLFAPAGTVSKHRLRPAGGAD